MKKAVFLVALCAILSMGNTSANASLWDFSTIPANGAVSGPPGSPVSWKYDISNNDPINWLAITGLTAGPFEKGVPYDAFDYPIIQPGSSFSNKLYEFKWDTAAAPAGFTNSGSFTLSAEFWNEDPSGVWSLVSSVYLSTPYTATLTANAVPVPPSIVLMASGLVGIWYLRRLRKK